jgi:hypothetical protein
VRSEGATSFYVCLAYCREPKMRRQCSHFLSATTVMRAALFLLALAAPSGAQSAELVPGQKVRLVAPSVFAGRFQGTVLERRGDSIVVAKPGGVPTMVSFSSIDAAQVSRGKSRARGARKGTLWGLGVGGGLALLVGIPAVTRAEANGTADSDITSYVVGQLVFGGAFWGAIIGTMVGSERWDPVKMPGRVTIVPLRDGLRVGYGIAIAER